MNKFAAWIYHKDKKQRAVADKLGISTATLHEILRKDHVPTLKIAYEIERYTEGDITLYDWIDSTKTNKKTGRRVVAKEKPREIL